MISCHRFQLGNSAAADIPCVTGQIPKSCRGFHFLFLLFFTFHNSFSPGGSMKNTFYSYRQITIHISLIQFHFAYQHRSIVQDVVPKQTSASDIICTFTMVCFWSVSLGHDSWARERGCILSLVWIYKFR